MVRISLGIDKSLRFTKRNIHTVHLYASLFSKVSLDTDGVYTLRCESWGVPILESNNNGRLGVDIGKPEWLSKVCILQGNDIGRNLIHTVSDASTLLSWKLWNCYCSWGCSPHHMVIKSHRIKIKPTKPLPRLTKNRIWKSELFRGSLPSVKIPYDTGSITQIETVVVHIHH